MSVQANCPACGAKVRFEIGTSLVTVCAYCRSAVGRKDRALEDLGKVADLAATGSPLSVGLKGRYRGKGFTIVGRTQYQHSAGGVWDEWYCHFSNRRWGWLAEAQGKFYLTTPRTPGGKSTEDEAEPIPALDELQVGGRVAALPGFVVTEIGHAVTRSAEGEIPFVLRPGSAHPFVDLEGRDGQFATIDYSDGEPAVYVGRQATLDELGIAVNAPGTEAERTEVAAAHLNCPQCAGPLTLQVPDKTERIGCPNCGALVDCHHGELKLFESLRRPKVFPKLELGSRGTLFGTEYTVLGFLRRYVTAEGIDYPWSEYLLHNRRLGFRWLVESQGHWNFVEPVPAGNVVRGGPTARYDGRTYKSFQTGRAFVRHVAGEFYWKVTVGEAADTQDYVAPPYMLSVEKTVPEIAVVDTPEGREIKSLKGEIHISHGTYVPVGEVQQAFRLAKPPTEPTGVSPNQPFPGRWVYKWWGLFVLLVVLAFAAQLASASKRQVFTGSYRAPAANMPAAVVFPESTVKLSGWKNLRIRGNASVSNSWVYLEGDLFHPETGLVQSFALPIEYYHGVDSDGAWSEGSQSNATFVSSLPAGEYQLRFELTSGGITEEAIQITIEEGVPRWLTFFLALLAVSAVPIVIWFWHLSFEHRRWENADSNPYEWMSSWGSGDDD